MIEVPMGHQDQIGRQIILISGLGGNVDYFAPGSDNTDAGLTHI